MSLKIAVVGTGNVARGNYLPYLSKQSDVQLSYYNRTRQKADDCAARFGGRVAETIADLVAEGPDAVLVLTAEQDRYAAGMEVLAHRPRRVFFEKPLSARQGQANVTEADFVDAREMLRTAKQNGVETAMVFNYRFFDQTLTMRRIVEERAFGALRHVSAMVHYACWSHSIDLIHLFAGPAAHVTALDGASHRWGNETATDLTASFLTTAGASGTILGTCGLDFRFPLFELTFSFEGGRLACRGLDGDLEILDYRTNRHEVHGLYRQVSQWDQYAASFEKSLAAYLDSIRAGGPPPIPGLAGLQELQFEAALRRAAREQRPVDVQTEFPLD